MIITTSFTAVFVIVMFIVFIIVNYNHYKHFFYYYLVSKWCGNVCGGTCLRDTTVSSTITLNCCDLDVWSHIYESHRLW